MRFYIQGYVFFDEYDNDEEDRINISFHIDIDNNTLFEGVPYDHVNLMLENDDVIDGMNLDFTHTGTLYSLYLNEDDDDEIKFYFEFESISCDSEDDVYYEIDNYDEYVEVIKDNYSLFYEYDTHYDCYCKTRRVCGCGCDPLHDGW